jgi:hypothetical protein
LKAGAWFRRPRLFIVRLAQSRAALTLVRDQQLLLRSRRELRFQFRQELAA